MTGPCESAVFIEFKANGEIHIPNYPCSERAKCIAWWAGPHGEACYLRLCFYCAYLRPRKWNSWPVLVAVEEVEGA